MKISSLKYSVFAILFAFMLTACSDGSSGVGPGFPEDNGTAGDNSTNGGDNTTDGEDNKTVSIASEGVYPFEAEYSGLLDNG